MSGFIKIKQNELCTLRTNQKGYTTRETLFKGLQSMSGLLFTAFQLILEVYILYFICIGGTGNDDQTGRCYNFGKWAQCLKSEEGFR